MKKTELTKPKREAFTAIADFMCQKPIVLTADEEKILHRWIVTDGWLRQNSLTTDEIVTKLISDFGISQFTALNDIRNTQKLFALSRTVNKAYVGHLHLERINKDIEATRERIFYQAGPVPGVKVARVPDAKELAALAKLHQAYTDILNSMPEEQTTEKMQPPTFLFNQVGGSPVIAGTTLDAALMQADAMLNAVSEAIDYEDLGEDE